MTMRTYMVVILGLALGLSFIGLRKGHELRDLALGLGVSLLLVFVFMVEDFAIPQILGFSAGIQTLSMRIYHLMAAAPASSECCRSSFGLRCQPVRIRSAISAQRSRLSNTHR